MSIVGRCGDNRSGVNQNGKSVEQSHATGTIGELAALPCQDPPWQQMPVTGGKGTATMQDARRDKPRRTQGQSQCLEAWRTVCGGDGSGAILARHGAVNEINARSRLGLEGYSRQFRLLIWTTHC